MVNLNLQNRKYIMKVLTVRNVNEALYAGLDLISRFGIETGSRNGRTLEVQEPVAMVYKKPYEKVLINHVRDANPFFHMFEALWILAGRQDVAFLNEFNKQMVNYSDNGETFNAPYGHRLRTSFGFDQIHAAITTLKEEPLSRQVVMQIWDTDDMLKDTKDKACNMQVVFKIRVNNTLDMTIYNRSNDLLWGMCGANAVQFAMLQEYVAAHLNMAIGTYTQITNSLHVYLDGVAGDLLNALAKPETNINTRCYENQVPYCHVLQNDDIKYFDADLKEMFKQYDEGGVGSIDTAFNWRSRYFNEIVIPMLNVWTTKQLTHSLGARSQTAYIVPADWRTACYEWLNNRIVKVVNFKTEKGKNR